VTFWDFMDKHAMGVGGLVLAAMILLTMVVVFRYVSKA
jgi:TRAP-type C4-dicarboxylate transport system permease small subunit